MSAINVLMGTTSRVIVTEELVIINCQRRLNSVNSHCTTIAIRVITIKNTLSQGAHRSKTHAKGSTVVARIVATECATS